MCWLAMLDNLPGWLAMLSMPTGWLCFMAYYEGWPSMLAVWLVGWPSTLAGGLCCLAGYAGFLVFNAGVLVMMAR